MIRYNKWVTAGVALTVAGLLAGCGSSGNDTSAAADINNIPAVSNNTGGVDHNPNGNRPSPYPNVPANESLVFQTLSNNGDLKIVEYQSRNNGMPRSGNGYVLYKSNGTWHQLYHTTMVEGTFAQPMWFHYGNVKYAVLDEDVSPGDWSGETMQIVRVSPERHGWSTKLVVNRDINHGIVLGTDYRAGNSLFVQHSHVLGISPVTYSFFDNEVSAKQVSIDYPGKIPNSIVYTLHVKVNSNKQSTTVNLSGSTRPLSLKTGQTLVVCETGDTYPIYVSAATSSNGYSTKDLTKNFEELMSPYRKAILFKAVQPFNGYLSFSVHFAGPNNIGQTGISSVPLEVK